MQVQEHTISSTMGTRMLRMATLDANSVVIEAASVIRNMSAGAGRLLRPLNARDSVFVRPVFCIPAVHTWFALLVRLRVGISKHFKITCF